MMLHLVAMAYKKVYAQMSDDPAYYMEGWRLRYEWYDNGMVGFYFCTCY